MTSEKEVLPKLRNVRWEGKYNLYCDVSVEGRTTHGVKLEGYPIAASDTVWLPPNHALREHEAAKVCVLLGKGRDTLIQ